jgi:hypothetical protein
MLNNAFDTIADSIEDAPVITTFGLVKVQGEYALARITTKGAEILDQKITRGDKADPEFMKFLVDRSDY